MLIAQLSDLHLAEGGRAGPAGIDARAALERAVAWLRALATPPDHVVLSGDLVEHGSAAEYRLLCEALAPLTMPVHPMPGNHDDREALRRAFPERPELADAAGFIQYAVDTPELRLLMLDTLLPGSHAGLLCERRLAWLAEQLAQAPGRPTLLFLHHPPLRTGLRQLDKTALAGADALERIVSRHPQVERIACGHTHRATTARWAGSVVSVCPSLVHQFAADLRPEGANTPVDEGPGLQLHRWHAGCLSTYTVQLDR